MFKPKITLLAIGLGFCCQSFALPDSVQFTNDTNIALNTSLAGLPGRGIEANITKSVPLAMLQIGCYQTNQMRSCPIEFFNRANGEKVASVLVNAETLTVNGAPQIEPAYQNKFFVSGWEGTPISHIKISNKKI